MTSHTAVYVFLLLSFNTIQSNSAEKKTTFNISYELLCQEKTCIPKCCPKDYVVKSVKKSCIHYPDKSLDFSDFEVYDADITKAISTVKTEMRLITDMFNNETFKHEAFDISKFGTLNVYLTEDGVLYIESPNSYNRWLKRDSSSFCIDYYLRKQSENPSPRVWASMNDLYEEPRPSSMLSFYALLIICIFLLLLLIIYPLVPTNRTVNGVLQLLSILSLVKVFVLLCVMSRRQMMFEECLDFTYSIYYFYLAAFCWMTVIAFDIWKTFRNYIKTKPICCNNGIVKMIVYCLYAWGVPLFMTIGLIVMNNLDLGHMPWIIQPQIPKYGCFINGGEKALYLFVPSLILLLCCAIFYLMTARYMIRLKRNTLTLNQGSTVLPAELHSQWQRFKVNVALLAVVFLHCSLEIISTLSSSVSLMYIADVYGFMFGPLLFFILIIYTMILRRNVFRKQRNRAPFFAKTQPPCVQKKI